MDVVCDDVHWYVWLLSNACVFTVEDQDDCRWAHCLWLSPEFMIILVHRSLVEGRNKDLMTSTSAVQLRLPEIITRTEFRASDMPYHIWQVHVTWWTVNMKYPIYIHVCIIAVVRQRQAALALQYSSLLSCVPMRIISNHVHYIMKINQSLPIFLRTTKNLGTRLVSLLCYIPYPSNSLWKCWHYALTWWSSIGNVHHNDM